MIAGSLPNPANHSTVTAANNHQNRLRTAGDHEFCLDDKKGAPVITMRTYCGYNMLHFDAALAEHRLRLASNQVNDDRDLVASVKLLVWDNRYNEYLVWVVFLFTLIDLVPTVGSLAKGILQLR